MHVAFLNKNKIKIKDLCGVPICAFENYYISQQPCSFYLCCVRICVV